MLVVLSQKVDSASSYADELFRSYHYPAKYKNQLHKGDILFTTKEIATTKASGIILGWELSMKS